MMSRRLFAISHRCRSLRPWRDGNRLDPVLLVIGLVARAASAGNRTAARIARVVFGRQSPDDERAIDEALQQLAQKNAVCAELVKLRFFTGLTLDEAAAAMSIARRTAYRYWTFARAWLFDALRPE